MHDRHRVGSLGGEELAVCQRSDDHLPDVLAFTAQGLDERDRHRERPVRWLGVAGSGEYVRLDRMAGAVLTTAAEHRQGEYLGVEASA